VRDAATRVFSNAAGSYSANVGLAIENGGWEGEQQLQVRNMECIYVCVCIYVFMCVRIYVGLAIENGGWEGEQQAQVRNMECRYLYT